MRKINRHLTAAAGTVGLAVVLAACGGSGSSAGTDGEASSAVSSFSSETQNVSSLSSEATSSSSSEATSSSSSEATSSSSSEATSSLNSSSSELSGSSESNMSSSSDIFASSSSSEQLFSRVTVSDAYVLEANVTVDSIPADIRLVDGVYEWVEPQRGALVSLGGANDLAAPKHLATSDDPNAYPMAAPEGYEHINPFTTMLVLGGFDLNTSYPAAAAKAGENGLPFNYDVVAAGTHSIQIAKETAMAALIIAQRYPAPISSSSVSSVAISSSSVSSAASSTSGTPGSDGPFPAAGRGASSLESVFAEIEACATQSCIDDVLLRTMMTLRGAYQPLCEPLPGEDGCTQGGGAASSLSSAVSSQTQSSSAPTASSSSSAAVSSSNPFPE